MGYADEPCAELTRRLVAVAADGDYRPRERLLEDVVGDVALVHEEEYVGIYIRLVSAQYRVECTVVAFLIQLDQLIVGHCIPFVHYPNYWFRVMFSR